MDGRIKLCNFHLKNIVCFYGQKEIKNDIMQKSTYVFCQILTEEKSNFVLTSTEFAYNI